MLRKDLIKKVNTKQFKIQRYHSSNLSLPLLFFSFLTLILALDIGAGSSCTDKISYSYDTWHGVSRAFKSYFFDVHDTPHAHEKTPTVDFAMHIEC